MKPKNGTLPGHKILSLAKVQRFVLFNESCKSKFLSRSDSFHVRGLSFLYTPLKSMDEMLLKEWQLIQIYWWFYKKLNSWKQFSAMHEECALLPSLLVLLFCHKLHSILHKKSSWGWEQKKLLHATFSFGDSTVKWNKQKTSMYCHKPQGTHTIGLCIRLLFYSKCTGFTVCFTYGDISLTMHINQW